MVKPAVSQPGISESPLNEEELHKINAYWRAALYLCAGMIYLKDNPLLKEPLRFEHIKKRLLGHWGSDPGQCLVWVHLNRMIKKEDLNMIYISGPGHGAPAMLANAYLEGTFSEIYPEKSQDEQGLLKFFKEFSFPGGLGSHCTPQVPGSIHEGGELGYSISHAFGAAFDNPDLIVAVMVGDGEAETGPLATSWHSNKFLNPARDGAVLPILHLNGYKIANPTILARISHEELENLLVGYGYHPYFVEGSDPENMHQQMAGTLEAVLAEIRKIQHEARAQGNGNAQYPQWPMIVLRTPKGWTCPEEVDGHKVENFWRSHQIPFEIKNNPDHLKLLETWMRSYKPEELFDKDGRFLAELKELAPAGSRRLSANPIANGGLVRKPLKMPDFRDYAIEVPEHGKTQVENTRVLGGFLRDVMRENMTSFRVFGPDETASNRLDAIYDATKKVWMEAFKPEDADGGQLARDGRVMEMLSEHTLEGWLEGYLLTGRHGFFASYEAFIHVIDSMFNQHAKWLERSQEIPWRAPISSLNLLIT
jgi:xylulose-5-phosphate/fructose-6-phosphate phosphoketolase